MSCVCGEEDVSGFLYGDMESVMGTYVDVR